MRDPALGGAWAPSRGTIGQAVARSQVQARLQQAAGLIRRVTRLRSLTSSVAGPGRQGGGSGAIASDHEGIAAVNLVALLIRKASSQQGARVRAKRRAVTGSGVRRNQRRTKAASNRPSRHLQCLERRAAAVEAIAAVLVRRAFQDAALFGRASAGLASDAAGGLFLYQRLGQRGVATSDGDDARAGSAHGLHVAALLLKRELGLGNLAQGQAVSDIAAGDKRHLLLGLADAIATEPGDSPLGIVAGIDHQPLRQCATLIRRCVGQTDAGTVGLDLLTSTQRPRRTVRVGIAAAKPQLVVFLSAAVAVKPV